MAVEYASALKIILLCAGQRTPCIRNVVEIGFTEIINESTSTLQDIKSANNWKKFLNILTAANNLYCYYNITLLLGRLLYNMTDFRLSNTSNMIV